MRESRCNTVSVPLITAGTGLGNPARIASASEKPWRAHVRNVSPGATILISYDANTLQIDPIGADVAELPPGTDQDFYLAPHQGLFAASTGAAGRVSIAESELVVELWQPKAPNY